MVDRFTEERITFIATVKKKKFKKNSKKFKKNSKNQKKKI